MEDVGKSRLLLRLSGACDTGDSIGVDFKIRNVDIDGEHIKLQIWDTAGQEKFKTITSTYYRGAHGIIVAYDVTDRETFNNIKQWLDEIDKNCPDGVIKILVGIKDDNPDCKAVSTLDAQRFAEQMGIQLYETSLKENKNVEEMLLAITKLVLQSKKEQKKTQADQASKSNESNSNFTRKQTGSKKCLLQ